MATATEAKATRRAPQPEHRFLLPGVGWGGYEVLLTLVGDGHVRLACDGEDVELMSPSFDHEDYKGVIRRIIEAVLLDLKIPWRGAGSTTWRSKATEKGLEADECYYLTSLHRLPARRSTINLDVHPAPDLALEIEISRGALNRMEIYASLGVAEVWRFDGETLTVERRQDDGSYRPVPVSVELPALTPADVVRWVRLSEAAGDENEWALALRDWVQNGLTPRPGEG